MSYLVNDPKYAFLKELGIGEKNHGVFHTHGKWFGNGEVGNTYIYVEANLLFAVS